MLYEVITVARYGGDEFVVVMTSANKDQALIYADSIRETIASTKISVCEGANPIGVITSYSIHYTKLYE